MVERSIAVCQVFALVRDFEVSVLRSTPRPALFDHSFAGVSELEK
jgi:hypothetical protein